MLLHAKVLNTQFEGDFSLACLGVDDDKVRCKSLRNGDENNDKNNMSISPLILQFSHLEDSNFKDQFFVTRSSFQVNHIIY